MGPFHYSGHLSMRLPAQLIFPFESRERSRTIKSVNIEAKIERFKDQEQ